MASLVVAVVDEDDVAVWDCWFFNVCCERELLLELELESVVVYLNTVQVVIDGSTPYLWCPTSPTILKVGLENGGSTARRSNDDGDDLEEAERIVLETARLMV
mmetsp:Transcript_61594/g.150789  ORF Transcript_61594/g.150789 Transcript_61594/m.150789 type:complete len:103 (-) Transcript_61594:18-326(-)